MNIPVAHVQGGEITGSIDEKVRHAVTKLANLHLVVDDAGRRAAWSGWASSPQTVLRHRVPVDRPRGRRGGEPGARLRSLRTLRRRRARAWISRTATWWSCSTRSRPSTRRRARTDRRDALRRARRRAAGPVVLAQRRRRLRRHLEGHPRVPRARAAGATSIFFKNMSPEGLPAAARARRCLVGNSSVGIRECSYLGVPSVNIGTRQQGRERGRNVIDVGHDRAAIVDAHRRAPAPRPAAGGSPLRRRRAGTRSPSVLAIGAAHHREAADLLMADCHLPRAEGAHRRARLRLRVAAQGRGARLQPVRRHGVGDHRPPRSLRVSGDGQRLPALRAGVPEPAHDRGRLRAVLRRRLPAARQRLPRPPDRRADDPGRAARLRRGAGRDDPPVLAGRGAAHACSTSADRPASWPRTSRASSGCRPRSSTRRRSRWSRRARWASRPYRPGRGARLRPRAASTS